MTEFDIGQKVRACLSSTLHLGIGIVVGFSKDDNDVLLYRVECNDGTYPLYAHEMSQTA